MSNVACMQRTLQVLIIYYKMHASDVPKQESGNNCKRVCLNWVSGAIEWDPEV